MRLIIFDIDGTLLDSRAIILASHAAAFGKHGLGVPDEAAIMALVGLSQRETFVALAGEHGPVDGLIAAYQEAVWAFRATGQHAETLFPGAAELVADLAARPDLRLALATGKGRRGTDLVIEQHGWRDIFHSSHTSDENPSKPDPTMLHRAMEVAGVTPQDSVMIGDSPFDMRMAVAAGVTPIGVAWGHQPRERLLEAGAKAVAEDFADLARLLDLPARD
ncbi:MAG TPA: HAD-IA family hydrolase [Dongiaceae bacterium]|nr:HAD-IA family hydrolase [Dongiaceae bacterium]